MTTIASAPIRTAIGAGILGLAAFASSFSAQAAQINATFGLAGGLTSFSGSNLNTATQIVFTGSNASAGRFNIVDVPDLAFGNPNDFFLDIDADLESDATPTSISTLDTGRIGEAAVIGGANKRVLNITGFSAVTDFMVWSTSAGNTWHFDVGSLVRNATSAGALDVYLLGTFRDTSGTWDNGGASLRLTANQSSGGALSWSATWSSPPAPNPVPEPTSLFLMGAGLGLVGFASRRRKAA